MRKIASILMLLAVSLTARAFSFSATAPTGQTLYFDVTSGTTVSIVNPDWDYHVMPTGTLEIPSTVSHGGTTYSVTAIGRRAFFDCSGITHVTVPQSVHTIGTLAFGSCSALDTIDLPATLDSIGSEAFNNCGYYNNATNWVDGKALYIGDYLVRVSTSAAGTFTIREGTLGIGGMAMYYCHSVAEVSVAQTVGFIGPLAFKDCAELDTVHMFSDTPPALAMDAFDNAYPTTVKVPCGSLGSYRAAPYWGAQHLVEAPCPAGIGHTAAAEPAVRVTADGIIINGAQGLRLTISDITGRRIAAIDNAAAQQDIALPQAGVYVVGIEGRRPVKIIYL